MKNDPDPVARKPVPTRYALAVMIGAIAIVILANVFLDAPLQPMFLLVWLFVYPMCMRLGYSFQELDEGAMQSIKDGMGPVLIVLSVGGMIGTWISAGTISTIIYAGLNIISPKIFLFATFAVCSAVSLACGTSWGTLGTAGIAMFAIGESLGVPSAMTVGAVASGSFLGDMISPMSDSPSIAAGVCKVDLITHIKELARIALPSFALSAVFYLMLGFRFSGTDFDAATINELKSALSGQFSVGLLPMVPLIVLFALILMKQPTVLSMLTSSVTAMLIAIFVQGVNAKSVVTIFWSGYSIDTGNTFLDTLLNRGGVTSMAATAMLFIFAFGMLGVVKTAGVTEAIVRPLTKRIKTTGQLTVITQLLALFGNMMGTNQFAMLMTGSLMLPMYQEFKLHPTNLSKLLNATSTGPCIFIPWNASGIYVVGMFGISTFRFAPYAIFTYLTPVIALLYGLLHIRVLPAAADAGPSRT